MVEEIQKIKLTELSTIRIVYGTSGVWETSIANLAINRPPVGIDDGTLGKLMALARSLQDLSNDAVKVGVEFVIPVKR